MVSARTEPGKMALSVDERLSLLEYKMLALSVQLQRLEMMLSSFMAASDPTLIEMSDRLSEIDGLGTSLPLETMTVAKVREMLGNGTSPRRHKTLGELLNLNLPG